MRRPRGNVAKNNIAYCNTVAFMQQCSIIQRDNFYMYDRGYSVEPDDENEFSSYLALKLLSSDLKVPFQYLVPYSPKAVTKNKTLSGVLNRVNKYIPPRYLLAVYGVSALPYKDRDTFYLQCELDMHLLFTILLPYNNISGMPYDLS